MFRAEVHALLVEEFNRDIEVFAGGYNLGYMFVAYDFDWAALKGNNWHQFRYGRSLAQMVKKDCPPELEPVLFLTNFETRPRFQTTSELFIAIVPFRMYLDTASPDPARSFFAYAARQAISSLLEINPEDVEAGQVRQFLTNLWNRPAVRKELLTTLKTLFDAQVEEAGIEEALEQADLELLLSLLTSFSLSQPRQDAFLRALNSEDHLHIRTAAEALRQANRREVVQQFEQHLADGTYTEPEWETFLRNNPWLLGLSLKEYVFLSEIQGQPDLGGKDVGGTGGQRGDSLMASAGAARFTVLVALKLPSADLVSTKPYRNKAYVPGQELIGAVSQVQAECFNWDTSADNINKKFSLKSKFTHAIGTEGVVVVGNLSSVVSHEDRLASFHNFRRSIRGVTIVTFDELLERAKALVS
ncbi:MAG TPA: Shedu anti-phage system protein SduA domain-containing protein [Fimbriimonadaceae bacterium]|nr:Shedu anti-phage system protein SduA domain-containing protein [Fimbriimonadaceae bacterium]